jgi:hypothetical protein
MPVINPFAPGAFQQPQQAQPSILSPSTISAGTLKSGTPFDIISQFVAGEQAKKSDAARQTLEAERFGIGREDIKATAEAKLASATLEHERAQETAKTLAKAKVDAAKAKVKADKEAARLTRQQKLTEAKAKKAGGEKITKSTTVAAATEDELKLAGDLVEALDPAYESGFFSGNKKELARIAAAEAKAIQAQAASVGNAISFPQAMRQYYQTGTSAPTPPITTNIIPAAEASPLGGAQDFTKGEFTGVPNETVTPEMETIKAEFKAGRMTKEEAVKKINKLKKGGARAN